MSDLPSAWVAEKQRIEQMLAESRITAGEAAKRLRELDYRIRRRPLILKRRRDRRTYRKAHAQRLAEVRDAAMSGATGRALRTA